jgi:hypothetical protein
VEKETRRGTWRAELRQYLTTLVNRGRSTVSCGELYHLFGDHIPLEAASRKWAAGRGVITRWESPERMRFYTLTQYLHWLQCSFTPHGRPKTSRTLVSVYARECPHCHAKFVAEKQVQTCGSQNCKGRSRRHESHNRPIIEGAV